MFGNMYGLFLYCFVFFWNSKALPVGYPPVQTPSLLLPPLTPIRQMAAPP